MNKKMMNILVVLLVLFAFGCSSVHNIRPLKEGEHKASVSLGGPLFDSLGVPLPIPLLALDYQYGVTEDLTVGGNLHLTPLIFKVFGMMELNGSYQVLDQQGAVPALSGYLNSVFMTDLNKAFVVIPEVGIIPSWKVADFLTLYGGISLGFNFYPRTAELPAEPMVIPTFPLGALFTLGDWDIGAEVRLLHPAGYSGYHAVRFIGFDRYGAFAPSVSVSYSFGG